MFHRIDIKAEQVAGPQRRLHVFHMLAYATQAKEIETQFIQRLQHARVHIITLETDMAVMTHKIGLRRQHIHQEAARGQFFCFVQVYQHIGNSGIDALPG